MELAHLAARLARGKKIDPSQLVDEAWQLYLASCRKIKGDYLDAQCILQEAAARAAEAKLIPRPESYPVSFQNVEFLLLPKLKGRTAERAALFREYFFAELVNRQTSSMDGDCDFSYWDYTPPELDELREAAQERVAEELATTQRRFYDAGTYVSFAASFLKWHRSWTDIRNSEAKASNAKRGWEKRRKSRTAKTGPRPNLAQLKEILRKSKKGA